MMLETHQLLLFIAAGWLLNLTPGPDVLYIVSNALRSGTRAGIVAGLGVTAGCCVHIAAAAVGVGALLAASSTAFTVLKVVGAVYLVWMGVRHKELAIEGVQFHPESILTEHGHAMLKNFLEQAA